MEGQILHFSDWHYMTLDQQKRKEEDQMTCNGCKNKISGDFYGCTECKHYVCKSCVGLAPEIRHPFHREHPLTLFAQSPYKRPNSSPLCDACSGDCDGFTFHCSECKFDLHVNCATLMPTTNNCKVVSEQQTTHVYKASKHPLIPCYRKNKQLDFLCSVCDQHIKGTIYACLDCHTIMDESCIQLPQQITHHLHPQHTLTLTRSYGSRCDVCGLSKDRFCYSCSECARPRFCLDVRCASLMPKAIIENYDDQSLENYQVVQTPFTHPHDLVLCDITKGIFSFSCSACGLCINGTLYVCLQCNFLLHKSCAELPLQIKHPFHPPHPLVLDYKNSSVNYQCKACKCSVLGFKYLCRECDFKMDVTCASLTYSTLKFEIHKHPLAIFNDPTLTKRKMDCSVNCDSCEIFNGFPFFRCVPCDFSIKLCCLTMLPHKFKHSNHQHSLTLTYSFIKDHSDDDFDSEYYCDICEEMRELSEPTYYCEDCHYVAHTSCVFHEILPLLGRQWPLAPNEEIVMFEAKVDALIMKIESLTKLNQLEKRREEDSNIEEDSDISSESEYTEVKETEMIEAEVVSLRTKLETLTIKLDELKERHPHHIDGYQIGSIPSLGRKSVTILDDFDVVVKEDCSVESTKKDEDKDAESDGNHGSLIKLDEEIEAITIILETLSAKLEALKEKRALCVSRLELK